MLAFPAGVAGQEGVAAGGGRDAAGPGRVLILSTASDPNGFSRLQWHGGGGARARALSNIDFSRVPTCLQVGSTMLLNLNSRASGELATPAERALLSGGVKQFATRAEASSDSAAEQAFYALLGQLHAEVENRSAELAARAAAERRTARLAASERQRQRAELERALQARGRLPSTVGVIHLGTRGGKPVDARHVVAPPSRPSAPASPSSPSSTSTLESAR